MTDQAPAPEPRRNPLLTIFYAPRSAIRGIVSTNAAYGVAALTAVAGITTLFSFAQSLSLGDALTLVGVVVGAIALGFPIGIVMMWVMTVTVQMTGRWLNGTATREQIKAAVVWGNAPAVFLIPLVAVGCAIFGNEYFSSDKSSMYSLTQLPIVIGLSLAGLFVAVWTIVLTCHTVAEVQGFPSAWTGFINLLLAAIIMTIVGTLLGAAVMIPTLLWMYGLPSA